MTRPKNEDKYLARFGKNVASIRRSSGLTQEQVADHTGLTRETIGLIERGKKWVRLSTLLLLARGLGVDARDLLEGLR